MCSKPVEFRLADYLTTDEVTKTVTITKPLSGSDLVRRTNLALHGRSMILMYQATGEERYLQRARADYAMAQSIQVGFERPLGAITNDAA